MAGENVSEGAAGLTAAGAGAGAAVAGSVDAAGGATSADFFLKNENMASFYNHLIL
jgi:hypothetical protein